MGYTVMCILSMYRSQTCVHVDTHTHTHVRAKNDTHTTTITLLVVYFYVCCEEFKSAVKTTEEQQVSSFAAGLLQ